MKKLLTYLMLCTLGVGVSNAQEKEGKITVEITKEVNGEKKTFKGEYENEEQMKADPNYQEFAGDDDNFSFWFDGSDSDRDVSIHLDRLNDIGNSFFKFHFDDDGSNSFFHNFKGDSSGSFSLDSWNSADFMQHLKDLGIEVESLTEKLHHSSDGDDHVYVFSSKKIKIVDVEGEEFGKKGAVNESSKLTLDDLSFSPNPSSNGRFNIRFRVPNEDELEIKVYDLQGKEVYNRYFERFAGLYSESIDLSGQEEGMYLLEIKLNKRRLTKKIIIN